MHQPRSLHHDDVDVFDGIPCTSVPLLLLDVAETAPFRHLERIFEATERERQLDLGKLRELIHRSPGRRGRKPLDALLAQLEEPPPRLRSRFERRFFVMCGKAGIDRPETNALVDEFEVDMLWRRQKVSVELDSWEFHRTRQAFERDRRKLVTLQLRGFEVLPFTWRRLQTEPESLVAAVSLALQGAASVPAR